MLWKSPQNVTNKKNAKKMQWKSHYYTFRMLTLSELKSGACVQFYLCFQIAFIVLKYIDG